MTNMLKAGVAGLLFVAAPALADSPFDGTWKIQLASVQMNARPERYEVGNGSYSCRTCLPTPYTVPADGQYHRVADRPYWDELSVTLTDDHAATFGFKKNGRIVSTATSTVSADGKTMLTASHDTNNGGGVPIDATASMTRIGAPVAGAHLISGSWQPQVATAVSDAALTMTMHITGNRLHQTVGLGESLDATIGGAYTLNTGDPGRTMTKVERLGPRALRFTDMRGGHVVNVQTVTVSADGKSLNAVSRDPRTGDTSHATAVRQGG